jgi:polyphosphate kinase 2 (PPK2 family)
MGKHTYNRAGAERVMGFRAEEQARGFPHAVPDLERSMTDSGISRRASMTGASCGSSRRWA